jgi:hypothetical protein
MERYFLLIASFGSLCSQSSALPFCESSKFNGNSLFLIKFLRNKICRFQKTKEQQSKMNKEFRKGAVLTPIVPLFQVL